MAAENPGLIETITAYLGGAGTTVVVATIGRLMWHVGEVRNKRRPFFGIEMLWEIPIVAGMAIIGEGFADYFELSPLVAAMAIAMLAYLGPRWFEATFQRYINKKLGNDDEMEQ
jgi:hypothetical protein